MLASIINLRKKIFESFKEKAYSYEVSLSSDLSEFEENQRSLSTRPFTSSNLEELTESVEKSQVIFLGDFHTFDQNIRNLLRILKTVVNTKETPSIGVEMVDNIHQKYIDAYLNRHITELEFLESIRYRDSWRFPWSHYKLIFDFARDKNISVIGLNSEGTLAQRDEFATQVIVSRMRNKPATKMLVVFGELHIAINKIPKLVSETLKCSYTVIHQNLDEVYWKQVDSGKVEDVIKFQQNEFCLNSAPPWIKYESMVYWYENLCDDPDFDIHEYIIEKGRKIFSEDTQENFLQICEQLIQTSGLSIPKETYEDFNLYDHTRLEYIEKVLREKLNHEQEETYAMMMALGHSFKLPQTNTYYCSSYSINRLAYLSGIHLYHCKNKGADHGGIIESTSHFVSCIFEHCCAYFFSKIINPNRKCALYLDFVRYCKVNASYAYCKSVLDKGITQDELLSFVPVKRYSCATILGHFLGEYLYRHIEENSNQALLESVFSSDATELKLKIFQKAVLKNSSYQTDSKRVF